MITDDTASPYTFQNCGAIPMVKYTAVCTVTVKPGLASTESTHSSKANKGIINTLLAYSNNEKVVHLIFKYFGKRYAAKYNFADEKSQLFKKTKHGDRPGKHAKRPVSRQKKNARGEQDCKTHLCLPLLSLFHSC